MKRKTSSTVIVVCMFRTTKEKKSLNIMVSIVKPNIVVLIILFTTFFFLNGQSLVCLVTCVSFYVFESFTKLARDTCQFFRVSGMTSFLIPKKFNLRIYNVMCQNRSRVINSLSLSSFTVKQKTVWW